MAYVQLAVNGLAGLSRFITISQQSTIGDLYDEIAKVEATSDIRIIHGTRQLDADSGESLAQSRIDSGSLIVVCQRNRGGWNPLEMIRIKKIELTALEGHITLTREADMITLDDDEGTWRAKMPCGHVIGPAGMTQYAQSLVDERKYKFMCPHPGCTAEWPFFLVRHVACLSPDDLQKIQKKLSENYAELGKGCKQCPGCGTWCLRLDTNKRARCNYCMKHRRQDAKDFCWSCTKPWVGGGVVDCGNSGCDSRLRTLSDCAWKKINGVNCPSVRACPKCKTLIEHVAACKHMQCKGCNRSFCFLCLQLADDNGKFSCGSYSSACRVAPIQSTLI